MKFTTLGAGLIAASASGLLMSDTAQAATVLIPTDAAAWHKGSGGSNGTGNGGILKSTTDLSGFNNSDADPTNWLTSIAGWTHDFQGQKTDQVVDLPWIVYDLGSDITNLDRMLTWGVSEDTGDQRTIKNFNLYYADDTSLTNAANAVPVWASQNNLTSGVTEYDFQGGGWTKVNGGTPLLMDRGGGREGGNVNLNTIDGNYDLSGIASARYIGIEILDTYGGSPSSNTSGNRAGLTQIAFTQSAPIPEPGSLALLGLGGLAVARRRRG